MNFFTIVEILGFGGLDLMIGSEEIGSLSSMEDDGSEKCEEVEEHTSYELYHDEGFIWGGKWLRVMGNGGWG
ncbi:hypothetical protein D8674_041057 [Pyrus ussuriensis x Pyrus communis]|uniref:Uncharacterized protein n=1 Tax=Pyrus ussuriensis x Pyrus communis TaxID=2448454 RepID=A0A5N5G2J2_9ROSA|nr:hypothetical protein D8674_041057 [Pyrus ussuriensis x Pyrus communis]